MKTTQKPMRSHGESRMINIRWPTDTLIPLQQLATDIGIPFSELVREAVLEKYPLAVEPQP